MLKEAHELDRTNYLPEDDQAILPMMTALFVKSMGDATSPLTTKALSDQPKSHSHTAAKIFRMPLPEEAILNRSTEKTPAEMCLLRRPNRLNIYSQKDSEHKSVMRPLIFGISHHFNNLLMGIWGNATLIRMQLNQDNPHCQRALQIEELIQTGSFIIHTVLGYIGERRALAKKIRLTQLLHQIEQNSPEGHCFEDHCDFETALKWTARVQRPRMVAGSTARVLEVLLYGIKAHCLELVPLTAEKRDLQDKLEMIEQLIKRGFHLTRQLRLYASDLKPSSERFRLPSLVRRVVNGIYNVPETIHVNLDPGKKIPLVSGERDKLEWVFEQLIDNAIAAMPRGGTLDISLRTLQQEAVQDRCAVQKGSDYVVVTIKDNGQGISQKIQKNIFEPFFTHPKKKRRIGLGLAAADGVLKSHNGYIQVKSKHRIGSTFKVYLPIAGTALQDRKLKEAL